MGQTHLQRAQRDGGRQAELPECRRHGQRCIIPAEAFFEPNYETGKAVRWNIQQPGEVPMGIAGVYRTWKTPDGHDVFAMAMLTVNADDHPVMKRFHKPGEEKRIVVILDPADYSRWLDCPLEEATSFLKQWHGPLDASPAPLPPRAPKASSIKTSRPPPSPQTGDLF
jgi:putative SOS response-associated peptidase YedK